MRESLQDLAVLLVLQKTGDVFDPNAVPPQFTIESPCVKIYEFGGYTKMEEKVVPLSVANMLPRGCVIRNTETVVGLVSLF